jgi:predicted transcriptional regulator
MKALQTMTVSLPPAMIRRLEQVRKAERCTRSQLVHDALRTYLRFPVVTASRAELRGIRLGRAEIRRGEYVNLEQLLDAVDRRRRQTRKKAA